MLRIKPSTRNIYHIYNRGVDKRKIFLDEEDYFRFIHDLFEFNDEAPAINIYYKAPNFKSYEVGLRKISPKVKREPRKLLVELMAFCLMPNHFHLMARQLGDNGITEFMRKLGGGYTNYFNLKYHRTGSLMQGKYKFALIKNEAHFIHLPYYIHLNPLDMAAPEWREKKIENYRKAMKFLENYRWSSFQDYIGKKNFPSVTQREFLTEFFDSPQNYKVTIERWLKELNMEMDPDEAKTVFFEDDEDKKKPILRSWTS